jgi:integrase
MRWANLREGHRSLSEREAHEIAQAVYDWWIETYRDNPSDQVHWSTETGAELWVPAKPVAVDQPIGETVAANALEQLKRDPLEKWCMAQADELLAARGLVVDEGSRLKLAKAGAVAMQRASIALERMARGEDLAPGSPVLHLSGNRGFSRSTKTNFVGLDQLVDDWARERSPSKKTLYEWRRVIKELQQYLGHDDAARIASTDLNGWKSKLLNEGRRPKTIRDAKIAPVRAILQWGVDNDRLPANAAARVTLDVKVTATERKRSFTEAEATLVLSSARKQNNSVLRWVPWLGAYTGARVAELCQLRREDVLEIDGVWCMRITPEAGPLKTLSSERVVPVHSALIAEGFIKFAQTASEGPIFRALSPDKFGSRGGNGTKMVGRWVRSLGIIDARVSPNHSWRHRMKTLARLYELRPDIGDALVGHGKRSVGDAYGEFQIVALKRELEKIPAICLG